MTTQDQPAPVSVPGDEPAASRPTRSLRSRLPDETGVLVALVVLVVIIGVLRPVFVQPKSLFQLLSNASFTGMLALGMVFVVVIRDVDLSVGWIFNLSAIVAAQFMVWGWDPLLSAVDRHPASAACWASSMGASLSGCASRSSSSPSARRMPIAGSRWS